MKPVYEPEPAEGRKKALISLLGDEDPAVFKAVRAQLVSYGPRVVQWLGACARSREPLVRRRARLIIEHFGRCEADAKFLAFCGNSGEQLDIERGALLLSRTRYPEINLDAYAALLDGYAAELRARLDLNGPAADILNVIAFYLYEELKYEGNDETVFEAQNNYLSRVLDRRSGNPVSLCLVYLLVARRLELPVVGVALPGHFLCRFQTARDEIFIDAFNGGKLLDKADCVRYLLQIRRRLDEGYLTPVSPRRMLLLCCANLFHIHAQLRQTTELDRLQRYMLALAQVG